MMRFLLQGLSAMLLTFGASAQAAVIDLWPQNLRELPAWRAGAQAGPADRKTAEAAEPLARGDFAAAESILAEARRLDPGSPAPLLGMAEMEMRRDQPDLARRWLDEALEVAPADPRVSSALARYFRYRGNNADAERWFRNAISLDPGLPVLECDLGDFELEAKGRPDLAAKAYSRAVRLNPAYPGGHYGLGRSLLLQNQLPEAEASLLEAAELAPENPLPLQTLGELYGYQKRFDEAIESFAHALELAPDFLPALVARGEAYLLIGKYAEAVDDFRAIVEAVPQSDEAHFSVGRAFEAAGNIQEAKEAYRRAVTINADKAVALNNLAWLMVQTQDEVDQAVQHAEHAVRIAPEVAAFHDTLGAAYRAQGKTEAARNAYQRALALDASLQSSAEALRELTTAR
ncbi:MAG: tetratricopeptide repeat protein [Woeseia sp.]